MQQHLQKFSMPYTVLIGDLNYGQHVGGDAIIQIVHEARIRLFTSLGPFSEISVGENIGLIMTSLQIQFRQQLFYGDQIRIFFSVLTLKRTQFTLRSDIIHASNNAHSHLIETTFAFFDYHNQKICAAPPEFSAALTTYRDTHGE